MTYLATFAVVLALVAAFAMAFGILSPDSLAYLNLAKSIEAGAGCLIDGKYFAVEPCGYPLAIAGVDLMIGGHNLVAASKLANLLMIGAAFLLLLDAVKSPSLCALFFINPIVLTMFSYTWSENAFLLACCGAIFCLNRLRSESSSAGYVALLALFLVWGCLSRYFFGAFCAVLWLAALAALGRRAALRSVPAFVVAAIVYIAYQKLNATLTGYPTGIARVPALETTGYLMLAFVMRTTGALLMLLATVMIYRLAAGQGWKVIHAKTLVGHLKTGHADLAVFRYLLIAGLGYLAMILAIRLMFLFDLFDYRIIGFGVVATGIAVLGLGAGSMESGTRARQCGALLAVGLLSLASTQSMANWQAMFRNTYQTPEHVMTALRSPLQNATIVAFGTPWPSPTIAGAYHYFSDASTVVWVGTSPTKNTETLDGFVALLANYADADCVVDFTWYANLDDFQTKVLNKAQPTALDFSKSMWHPGRLVKPMFAPELVSFLQKAYRPHAAVDCREILQLNH